MGNTRFLFKKFAVEQGQCAMKISTDAVLLGASVNFDHPKNILDIGTGTGVLALMLAQRFPSSQITAVEIEKESFLQANDNFITSPWVERIEAVFSDFNDFAKQSGKKFDLIVSNPPYYPNHLVSQNNKRNLALHHESLDFNELAEGVTSLLDKEGKLWLILPPDQLKIFDSIALKNQLFCQHITAIFDKPDSKNIRSIAAYSFYPTKQIEQQVFYIKDNQSEYSEMYQALLKDFLLKL